MSETSVRTRRWSWWLIASLCLNLFLVGVVVMGLIVARNRAALSGVGGGLRPEVVLQMLPPSGAVKMCKALATRMERAKLNPVKDKERAALIAPYLAKLKTLRENPPKSVEAREQLDVFRWMVEEYKVSLFAQELGTAIPVSPKRLGEQFQQII